ncbi:hypothetical protein [Microbispora hainanensis]|uniref:hypothetical protein n=1 Tax=Microbispora hainanensis TaxID=568844 RepID=UPI0033FF454A
MEWWKLGLEYLKIVVGWPLVVLAIAIVLRKPIATLLRRDLEAEAAGMKLRLGRAEEAVEEALGEATQVTALDATSDQIEAIDGKNNDNETLSLDSEKVQLSQQISALEGRLKTEQTRRAALERVLSEGARLGWEWARAGESEPPRIIVQWSSKGVPHVYTERSSGEHVTRNYVRLQAQDYEQRVLNFLKMAYPGSVWPEFGDNTYDARMILEEHSFGVIVKHYSSSRPIPASAVDLLLTNTFTGDTSLLFIANARLTREAQRTIDGLAKVFTNKVYWIQWSGDLHDDHLVEGLERIRAEITRGDTSGEGAPTPG